jgi:hypothetical protein
MTRSFDAIPEEADRSAELNKPSAPVMSVCPFCGAISEKSDSPCPRCKMENTALTRQATRARIGPWYVMQSRNPSAPGMKCSTLLALIRKDQITPKSVIRGPTTFQLWRFAARVKGISREFGLCYSCGAELQRTSTFCPRCSRSQELPPNPDALLENEPQAKTVYRQVNPRPESAGPAPTDGQQSSPSRPPTDGEGDRQSRPSTQIPSAAETMAELAEMPSPHNAPTDLQSRPRQRPQEGILSPRELAAAFSIQYDPTMDGATTVRRDRRSGWSVLVAVLMILLFGGGVAVLYFVPTLRQRFVAWVQDSSPAPAPAQQTVSSPPKTVTDTNPPWMNYVPDETPPITSPSKASVSTPSGGAANSSNPPAPVDSNPKPSNPAPTQQPTQPPPAISSFAAPPADAPQAPAQTAPAKNPPPTVDAPVVTSTPAPIDPRVAAAADVAAKLRQEASGDLDSLAMELRSSGLEAEAKQDYASAQYFYQQVEALPSDHWPGDIDRLLKNVDKHVSDSR